MLRRSVFVTALIAATPLAAQDAALVIGNENYRAAPDISGAEDALDAADALEAAGFTLRKGADLPTAALRDLLSDHYGDTGQAGRSVILLSGNFAHHGTRTWFLGTEAKAPGLTEADMAGLSLGTVLELAAERPGAAMVLLGTEGHRMTLGRGLIAGIGSLEVPQGVTVISGDAADIAAFAADILTRPGQTPAQLAARAGDLTVTGFLGNAAPFIPVPDAAPAEPAAGQSDQVERDLWATTQAIDTVQGYESYLRRYPQGLFTDAARRAIALKNDPAAQAKAAEDALRLTRDQRRQIQRDLSILDIDPRGIDGLFGRGSRAAIVTWQQRNRYEATGFVTAEQIAVLAAQAEKRAAELEIEAAKRQAQLEREDRLYWEQTGKAGDEAGLRAYIKRYPDGLFAELAQERLAVFDEQRKQEAAAADRAAWDQALKLNTAAGFREYLAAYPNGAFVEDAKQILDDMGASDADRAAKAGEDALGLNDGLRRMIEQRLAALNLKPGRIDGTFDKETRRAIRRYQQARGLPVTGYLSQQTVARLLVDSL
ncbi:putative peptidoglycan binding protein [Defluviimonas denitrificans]|jgi:peptidoglycan hydrolase-like protein with peptidoglycan-binding domain|uniref:Putative peptidoglycan binding protein n=1 Tax=Albidovulum denitrificans TaxID=404881 RepID=A0A2S8S726_9RHOB|nr:peptidoglycan-binding domain-containing protein [Defluviimonas denitrificans]PQV56548.1 putative peptidoglycan binding protein [Defluviimonas denitrificans]